MKKLSDGTVFDAVNGLWLSGLYGIGAGAKMGLITGAIVGTIVPIIGNIIGGGIGFLVGGVVGLPAGILGYGLGERRGWRIASCLSCLFVGSAIARLLFALDVHSYSTAEYRTNYACLCALAVVVFTLVGLCLGDVIYNRLKLRKDNFYSQWAKRMDGPAVSDLSVRSRAICLAIALVPVLLTYTQTVLSLVASLSR